MNAAPPKPKIIALAGNPNAGKTTLFNALTGLRQKTGNYPGVTVERRIGTIQSTADQLIDLPGTYSLVSRSPDERVAVDVITGRMPGTPRPDAVVVVVDASNLQRNLYLVTQIIELGVPMVVALNMIDVAARRGVHVDAEKLSRELGVPVVPVIAHKGTGLDQLKRAIAHAVVPPEPDWPLPDRLRDEIEQLLPTLATRANEPGVRPRALAEHLLVSPGVEHERILADPTIRTLVESARRRLDESKVDLVQSDIEAHYAWIESVSQRVTEPTVDLRVKGRSVGDAGQSVDIDTRTFNYEPKPGLSDAVDKVLLHRFAGPTIFVLIMAGLFVSIFFFAAPLMDFVEGGIGWLGGFVANVLPDGVLKDLWTDGIVAGVGAVLVFVPQIAILFLLLAILEDSGYLARAAFIMDRLLSRVGLSGKAFVPLLSGFACAIPAIMATRTMESSRDRLRTIFVLPFMSCSARLPVYALLVGAFFSSYAAWIQGGIVLGLYLLGIVAAFVTSWIWMKRTNSAATSSFILELPTYKLPQAKSVARVVATNTWAFVARAGTIIFCLSVILWAMTYWPRLPESRIEQLSAEIQPELDQRHANIVWTAIRPGFGEISDIDQANALADEAIANERDQRIAAEQLRQSIAGRIGHWIEPVIEPLGFDWKMGVGLVGAFAAREVFVSTMGIVYAAGDAEEDSTPLVAAMQSDRWPDGRPIWTPLVAINMLIWFVLAMQCMSTLAVVKRETGGWRWPIIQLIYMNGLAWVICLIVYQVGSRVS